MNPTTYFANHAKQFFQIEMVRLGAGEIYTILRQCSNHCISTYKQAFVRHSSDGSISPAQYQLAGRVP
jgi:hypothetical protein